MLAAAVEQVCQGLQVVQAGEQHAAGWGWCMGAGRRSAPLLGLTSASLTFCPGHF